MNQYTPPFKITPKIVNLVSEITEIVTKLQFNSSNAISPHLRKVNKIKTITGTLQIEGNSLDIQKVTALLEGKRVLATQKEIAEVQGAIKAYDLLDSFDYVSMNDLLKAHKILMGELLTNAGSFRLKDVGVGGKEGVVHIAPPSNQVQNLMHNLFDWLKNSDIHPLIKSSIFHYELEFIHPFIDGNGRIGRLWQTLILYNYKPIFKYMPIESIIKEHQQEYYKALEDSGSLGESTPFIEFMLNVILLTCKSVPLNDPKSVPLKRLDKVVELLKENKHLTINQIATICNVSSKTIKRDIAKLKELGKIKRVGSQKSGYWEII